MVSREVSSEMCVARADDLVNRQVANSAVDSEKAVSERVLIEANAQVKFSPAIPISDRSGEVLRFLTSADGDDGPRKVVRQHLEAEERRTRNQHHGQRFGGFDAALAPLADRLEALQAEVNGLREKSQDTNLSDWGRFVAAKPPSAAAIALLLVAYDRDVRTSGEAAVRARQESAARVPRPRAAETHRSVVHRSVVVDAMRAARSNHQSFACFLESASIEGVDGLDIHKRPTMGVDCYSVLVDRLDVEKKMSRKGLSTWWTRAGQPR